MSGSAEKSSRSPPEYVYRCGLGECRRITPAVALPLNRWRGKVFPALRTNNFNFSHHDQNTHVSLTPRRRSRNAQLKRVVYEKSYVGYNAKALQTPAPAFTELTRKVQHTCRAQLEKEATTAIATDHCQRHCKGKAACIVGHALSSLRFSSQRRPRRFGFLNSRWPCCCRFNRT